jgi:hypothetical protein
MTAREVCGELPPLTWEARGRCLLTVWAFLGRDGQTNTREFEAKRSKE